MKKIIAMLVVLATLVSLITVLPVSAEGGETRLAGTDVVLMDGVLLNFYIEADESLGVDSAEAATVNGKDCYVVPVELAAKEMSKTATAQLYSGSNPVGEAYSYSIAEYAAGILAGDYSEATKTFVRAMLAYGAAAQKYFGYETDNLVGTPVTDNSALKSADVEDVSVSDEDGVFYGATLVLDGKMKLRFYFLGTHSAAYVNGKETDAVGGVSKLGVEYSYVDVSITPADIDEVFEVEIGNTAVKYSPLNYLKNNADNPELTEMVSSIYAYSVAAENYLLSLHTPLENLQNEALKSYSYPMDQVLPSSGSITYTKEDLKEHKYVSADDWKVAFVEITDTVFDFVTITPAAENDYIAWSFLTCMPSLKSTVSYASGYTKLVESDTGEPVTVAIPTDANYLVVYVADADASVRPESVTFTKSKTPTVLDNLQSDTLTEYSYPIENIYRSQGTIQSSNNRYIPSNHWVTSFVDISGCTFNQVTLGVNAETGLLGYSFLTERPNMYDYVSFAKGYSSMIWIDGNESNVTKVTLAVPEDANCLVLYYMDPSADPSVNPNYSIISYVPAYVKFEKVENLVDPNKTPLENLQDEKLTRYEYPLSAVTPSEGTITYGEAADKRKFISSAEWKVALVDITGCTFDYVTFGVDDSVDYIAYSFLTRMPSVNSVVSFAGGYNKLIESRTGEDVTVTIPTDATVLVVYVLEPGSVVSPTSITFTKSEEKTPLENLQDATLPEYSYPVETILPSQGTLTERTEGFRYIPSDEWVTAFVDITGCAFDQLSLAVNAETGLLGYTFLTSRPHMYEYVKFAGDYTGWIWANTAEGDDSLITVNIPSDATCLVVYYMDPGPVYYVPAELIFINTKATDN